jgi:hypothetical protein
LPAGWLDAGPPRDDPTAAADERKIPECQAMLSTFPHTKRTKYASHEFDKGTISDVSAKAANEFATYVSEGVSKAKYAAFASADTKTCIEKYSDAAAAAQQKSVRLNATSPADRSVVYSVSATAASTPAFADGATGYDVTLTAVVEGVTKFQETVTFVAVRIGLSLLAFQFVSVGLADTSLANGVMAKCLQRITTGSEA